MFASGKASTGWPPIILVSFRSGIRRFNSIECSSKLAFSDRYAVYFIRSYFDVCSFSCDEGRTKKRINKKDYDFYKKKGVSIKYHGDM